jgi:hypothetical protein
MIGMDFEDSLGILSWEKLFPAKSAEKNLRRTQRRAPLSVLGGFLCVLCG